MLRLVPVYHNECGCRYVHPVSEIITIDKTEALIDMPYPGGGSGEPGTQSLHLHSSHWL